MVIVNRMGPYGWLATTATVYSSTISIPWTGPASAFQRPGGSLSNARSHENLTA